MDGKNLKGWVMELETTNNCAYCGKKTETEEPKEFWQHYPLLICCSRECSDAYFDKDYQRRLRRT